MAVGTALLLPVLLLGPLPAPRDDAFRIFWYDPPPPPPPPLPRGPGLSARPASQSRPAPSTAETAVPVPSSTPVVERPEQGTEGDLAGGDPNGSVFGVPEGMEGGVEGGVVGGVLGGVLGGVVGGTGTDPVPVVNPDRPPRLLRLVRPAYPPDAFTKKVAGTVLLEILIDERGRVVRARVLRSIPSLDDAALAAVRSWLFVPAQHGGRAVASLAHAPVTFTIY